MQELRNRSIICRTNFRIHWRLKNCKEPKIDDDGVEVSCSDIHAVISKCSDCIALQMGHAFEGWANKYEDTIFLNTYKYYSNVM